MGGAGAQVAEGELGGIVEGLPRSVSQCLALLCNFRIIQKLLGFEYRLLGLPEDGIHAADGEHGQDDILVFAPLEKIAENVVSDAPDKGDDFIVGNLIHGVPAKSKTPT